MKPLNFEKWLIIFLLLTFNIVFSTIATIYRKHWYIFIGILASSSLISSCNVLLIFGRWIRKYLILISGNTNFNNHFATINNQSNNTNNTNNTNNDNTNRYSQIKSNKYIYVVPCYKESQTELLRTINSLCEQHNVDKHQKILTVICDGKIPNKKGPRTDQILVNDIFKNHIENTIKFPEGYKTWSNKWINIAIHTGTFRNMKFILFIKDKNIGKRDSLTFIRRMCYYYNQIHHYGYNKDIKQNEKSNVIRNEKSNNNFDDLYLKYLRYFTPELINFIETAFNDSRVYEKNPAKIDYIIGTDADTIFAKKCAHELIKSIQDSSDYVVGVVGMVDICKTWNPLVIYQYCEYLFAQCLRRHMQSVITKKVNCLSGCVQLIKVCNETCGNRILNKFNYLPSEGENILNHVRSYASEDRNHLTVMFEMFPYVKTIQCMKAICYTNVPNSIMGFIRQRKRWSAGSASNDILLFQNKKHNMWERLQSLINVVIFSLTIFICVATIDFLISIITHPTWLMLALSSIMFLPIIYSLLVPICVYNDGISMRQKMGNVAYYYLGFVLYYSLGTVLSITSYFYTLYYLDDLHWNSKKINNNNDNLSVVDRNNKGIRFNIKIGKGILRFGCVYEKQGDIDIEKGNNDITENIGTDNIINNDKYDEVIFNSDNEREDDSEYSIDKDEEFYKQNVHELWDSSEI